jgi:hypothetical protein
MRCSYFKSRRRLGQRLLRFESLEDRLALSASIGSADQLLPPNLAPMKHSTGSPFPVGNTPAAIRQAYGFNNVSFGSMAGDGTGQTIAIVDAFSDPTIASDLAMFDQTFALPAPPNFTIVNQTGGTKLPKSDKGWAQEIALDVEWAHAIAPAANILLVEAKNASNLGEAVDYARHAPGVDVISMSAAGNEYKSEAAADPLFTTPFGHSGVTFVIASGDEGAKPEYPSSSPNVLSVGGSSLSVGWNGQWYRNGESVWSGSGGGVSQFEGVPSYQSGLGLATRGTPDVSYDGNPNTGFAVFDSFGTGGWGEFGGTSAGAPQWAALIAIADQGRAINGKGSLANAQAALYGVPRSDFFDITSGTNGKGSFATAGYDTASGLGSPIADLLIPDLASFNGSTFFTVAALPPKAKHGKSIVASPKVQAIVIGDAPGSPPAAGLSRTEIVDSLATAWGASKTALRQAILSWSQAALPVTSPAIASAVATPIGEGRRGAGIPSPRGHLRAHLQDEAFAASGAESLTGIDAYFASLSGA